jgi:ABC-type glycerol-3-phosphate transport system permease component
MARRERLIDLAWYVGMSLFLLVFLSPIIWVYLASLTPSDRLGGSPYAIFDIRYYTFSAFPRVWNGFGFSQAFFNSFVVCLLVALCVVVLCSLPAYALSRYNFWGREQLALAILLGQLVPGIVVVIPIVLLLRNIQMTDNLVGLGAVYVIAAIPFGTWLLRGFLMSIPRELDESVLVDGGGLFAVLRYVIFPLARPGLMTVAAFAFIGAWGEYLLALSLITSNQNWTLPLALQEAFSRNSVDLGALTAGGVIASLPVAILFMLVQRSLIAGLAAGSVKG